VFLPREAECVLLGAAIIGAVAAKKYDSIIAAMKALNAPGLVSRNRQTTRLMGQVNC
jgi:ribulose kinase